MPANGNWCLSWIVFSDLNLKLNQLQNTWNVAYGSLEYRDWLFTYATYVVPCMTVSLGSVWTGGAGDVCNNFVGMKTSCS